MQKLRPKQKVMVFIDRWFPDRQVLLRGPGRYSVLNVPQNIQLAAAGTTALTALWLASATVSFALSYHSAHQAARTNAQLQAELAAAEQKISQLNAAYASVTADRNAALAQADQSSAEEIARADAMMANNSSVLDQLTAQTQTSIHQVQVIIKATGLDPDRLARQAEPAKHAPLPETSGGLSAEDENRATTLMSDLHELHALTQVLKHVPLAAPVASMSVSSPFGYRADPWTGAREFHVGIDLRGPEGTAVTATAPGTVTYAGYSNGYGELVVIDHGFGLSTRYSHLDKIMVQVGMNVKLHQKIGLLGNTGWSTGPHLLYETRVDGQPQNPLNFIKVASNDVQK